LSGGLQVLVETFETGEHITKYVEMGPGAPHNAELAALGSGAMLQVLAETTVCWPIIAFCLNPLQR